MGAPRRRTVVKSRKVREDEGEDDGAPSQTAEDDSISGDSVTSDLEDDADAEGSDDNESGPSAGSHVSSPVNLNGHPKRTEKSHPPQKFATATDTAAMMNGLSASHTAEDEEVSFEEMKEVEESEVATISQDPATAENMSDKRRREHEEYKKRRNADPAFVPTRGEFFMHDHRSAGHSQNGSRSYGKNMPRGRGLARGNLPVNGFVQPSGPADAPWAHDLHDPAAEPAHRHPGERPYNTRADANSHGNVTSKSQPPNRDFSTTTRLGDMQIRLFISGMTEPKQYSNVARRAYTRLPYHRPPLRRDKPVRISIPNMEVKHIFPAADRSFIFIPRALRPNQQGFGKARGRGSFGGAGYATFGPLSSRRTSLYGGSAYSPTAILSRRSSLARDMTAPLISPTHAAVSRPPATAFDPSKPVVRLPPASDEMQQSAMGNSPSVNLPHSTVYAAAQQPSLQQNPAQDLPMHHPKPERSLQVGDLVSPPANDLNTPPVAQQQPFHQQAPLPMPPFGYPSGSQPYPHNRHPSHPSQASTGTPLQQIPEAAIHAQPFQPYGYSAPQGFYPSQYPVYYYPPTGTGATSPAAAQSFVPGQQYFYPMPLQPPPPPQAASTTQGGTVAHETGGMVYYYNSSDLPPTYESSVTHPSAFATAPAPDIDGLSGSPFYAQTSIFPPPSSH